MEIWKDIPGYDGRYQVSDHGGVRSVDWTEIVKNKWGGCNVRKTSGAVLTTQIGDKGRLFVTLSKNRKTVRRTIASLVALAFIGPRLNGLLVLHKDGNNQNNMLTNLRYGTQADNMEDARGHGTLCQGETQWFAKLTAQDVLFIRASMRTCSALAKMFSVTPAAISLIRKRKNWAHI